MPCIAEEPTYDTLGDLPLEIKEGLLSVLTAWFTLVSSGEGGAWMADAADCCSNGCCIVMEGRPRRAGASCGDSMLPTSTAIDECKALPARGSPGLRKIEEEVGT